MLTMLVVIFGYIVSMKIFFVVLKYIVTKTNLKPQVTFMGYLRLYDQVIKCIRWMPRQ